MTAADGVGHLPDAGLASQPVKFVQGEEKVLEGPGRHSGREPQAAHGCSRLLLSCSVIRWHLPRLGVFSRKEAENAGPRWGRRYWNGPPPAHLVVAAFPVGLGDADGQVDADVREPLPLARLDAEERAPDAAVFMDAEGRVGPAAFAEGDLPAFEVSLHLSSRAQHLYCLRYLEVL